MKPRWFPLVAGLVVLSFAAADWPQWRGPNRDAKVTGFTAPKAWPKELTKKWTVPVGNANATPALVGDRLYVFAREGGSEVTRCLDAASGKELWQDKYEVQGATPPAAGPHEGPRASPAVADGKVVTYGVRGTLSCLDAGSGKTLWRKDDFKGSWPTFYTSSSPVIADGLCIAQLGGKEGGRGKSSGGIVAYDLATGAEKWRWTEDSTDYASPALLTADGVKAVVAATDGNVVALGLADGKLLWKVSFPIKQRMQYNAATPVVDGQTVIYSGAGRGTRAVRLEKQGDGLAAKELWSNDETAVQYNTPIVKDGLVFGITNRDALFCIDAKSGKTAWTAPLKGGRGFGSVVDLGPVLMALTPAAQLVVFEPSDSGLKQVASYKVADTPTYAYPVVAGNRVFVKDNSSLTLWTIE
ncbi:MAG TPA: PQQ-binding-like beta-propeller repeat protein [Fimbriiglobus sp.]|jgi:outer membrane protein assembly factor BamB|nr:PQQ-binding-like beta-propeller repeat protein [Fimbriiglobus sp.]